MLISQEKRPRDLAWYHAGPLLFGDWGTSRLYVLGLAFAFTGFAAPYYLLGLSLLMIVVAWAYTIICSKFHDGGGVYTAARAVSPLLGVIGATLLMADYIVTAALSLVDAFHYFGVPDRPNAPVFLQPIFWCCAGTMTLLGAINWFGAKRAGQFALLIAILAMGLSAVVAIACIPFIPAGLRAMDWGKVSLPDRWVHFTSIILALSGVEAVANMTGIMKEPVPRTAKRTIWPILGEVATLNLVFAVAIAGLLGLAASGALHAFDQEQVKNAAMKVLAIEAGQHWFGEQAGFVLGKVCAIVFGLLLMSAANTVLVDKIGVLYSLGRDRELPRQLTGLNYSGVPRWPLIIAVSAPILVLLITTDLEQLSHLYAIGVCGAIALNMLSCTINRKLDLTRAQRTGLGLLSAVMLGIWVTIAVTKPQATLFAGILVGLVLSGRFIARSLAKQRAQLPEPAHGWLAELARPPMPMDPSKPRIMLAARGLAQTEFAVDLARRRKASLFVIFVRTIRVLPIGPTADASARPLIDSDEEAQEALGTAAILAQRYNVPIVPIYVTSTDVAAEILDYTVTYGCDTLIMGKSKRRAFAKALEGDVISRVVQDLPSEVALITRDATPHPLPPAPTSAVPHP